MSDISDLERDFMNEQKGEGSLTIHVMDGTQADYVGYDLNPEDIEALYFEGIGVPRWESLQADTVEQQTALYWERFNERMDKFPLIGRARDTDAKVEFASDEVAELIDECDKIEAGSTDQKAIRALMKVKLAAERAREKQAGLKLSPSQMITS